MLANRVKETTATTGTGSFTTAGAVAGFQTFNTAFGTNRRFTYWAVNDTDNEWETGIGYLSASTTLVRETVLRSTNSDAAVNFTTAPSLFCAPQENSLVQGIGVLPANTWVNSMHHSDGAGSNNALTANYAYLCPFLWTGCQPVDNLGLGINSAAGTKFRLAIYENNKGIPGDVIVQTGDLTPVSTTFVSGSVTSTLLAPGWYFVAVLGDGAIDVATTDHNTVLESPLGTLTTFWSTYKNKYHRHNYGGGWTVFTDDPSITDTVNNTNIPKIIMQVV